MPTGGKTSGSPGLRGGAVLTEAAAARGGGGAITVAVVVVDEEAGKGEEGAGAGAIPLAAPALVPRRGRRLVVVLWGRRRPGTGLAVDAIALELLCIIIVVSGMPGHTRNRREKEGRRERARL